MKKISAISVRTFTGITAQLFSGITVESLRSTFEWTSGGISEEILEEFLKKTLEKLHRKNFSENLDEIYRKKNIEEYIG